MLSWHQSQLVNLNDLSQIIIKWMPSSSVCFQWGMSPGSLCWGYYAVTSSLLMLTKLTDILPQDLAKSRSREIGCCNYHIALKFDRHLPSCLLNFRTIGKVYIPSLWLPDFMKSCGKMSVCLVNIGLVMLSKSLQTIWRSGTHRFYLGVPDLQMCNCDLSRR